MRLDERAIKLAGIDENFITTIKNVFGKLNPGQLVFMSGVGSQGKLYQYVDKSEDEGWVKVFPAGSIGYNRDGEYVADFIYNTQKYTTPVEIRKGTFSPLKGKQLKAVKIAYKSGDFFDYVNKIQKATGLKIKI